MGLIIFLVTGALLGWLAAIVQRIENGRGIMANVGAGALGAVAGGLIANQGSILSGVSPISIPIAIIAALAVLGILGLFRNRLSDRHF
ncbi:GlsB/YeaQ/YmgE family stress response membrane protein [Pelagerythrobacter sp.]|uniref:GlsB/YeaQ/YmgE family stress response membrane protein n=1 Tax=Pelagerythrobacter sp. TaxID=2800702 RepID=UPI0035B047D7